LGGATRFSGAGKIPRLAQSEEIVDPLKLHHA
jgi:hypothetical protein